MVKSALGYLGIENIRDNITNSIQTSYSALAAAGYKFDFVVTPAKDGTVDITKTIATLVSDEAQHRGSISAIEGPNEVNIGQLSLDGTTKSIAAAATIQAEIYTSAKATASLASIPVYNVSLGYTDASQYAQLGNLSKYTDYANAHAYVMSTTNVSLGLDYLLPFASISAAGKPVVITEAGYTTLTSYSYDGVSETVQAKYTLNTLMDAYQKGIAKTYLYELLDEPNLGANHKESHFGLFHSDGTPKPVATAIHNLTQILQDTGRSAETAAGSLTYALDGAPTTAHDMVFAKSNGSVDLVLWAEPVLWNQNTHSEVRATSSPVTVTFDHTKALIKVYDPMRGSSPIATYANASSIQVSISDHPLVIEVTPIAPVVAPTAPASTTTQTFVGGELAGETTIFAADSADVSDVKTYTDGVLTRETILHADNSVDVHLYGITNRYYVAEHDVYNKAGILVSSMRTHADGSLANAYKLAANGTKTTDNYDAGGVHTSELVVHADGSWDSRTYAKGVLNLDAITYAPGSANLRETKVYSAGVLTSDTIVHADKSQDVYHSNVQNKNYVAEHDVYNATGVLTSTVRTHSNGSYDYTYKLATDGTKTTDTYDAAGVRTSDRVVHADGSSEIKTYSSGTLTSDIIKYAAGSADYSDSKTYTGGVLTTDTIVHANLTKDTYDTKITGKSYVADHFAYDSAGRLVTSDLTKTDGSHTQQAYLSGTTLTSTTGVADTLTAASAGRDTLVFKQNFGKDTIVGFHTGNGANHDTIKIDNSLVSDFSHLAMQQVGHDTLIAPDAHDSILVKNVLPSALTSADFQFFQHGWVLS